MASHKLAALVCSIQRLRVQSQPRADAALCRLVGSESVVLELAALSNLATTTVVTDSPCDGDPAISDALAAESAGTNHQRLSATDCRTTTWVATTTTVAGTALPATEFWHGSKCKDRQPVPAIIATNQGSAPNTTNQGQGIKAFLQQVIALATA